MGESTDRGLAALYFSGCRENDVQADGEYDILTLGSTPSGFAMNVSLGSALTSTAFTLKDYGPGYSALLSETTMTGLPMSVTVTVAGSAVTSMTVFIGRGGMIMNDLVTDQTYSVILTNLSDAYALSTSATGTTTTYTTNGTFGESWLSSSGSNSMTATFSDFQLAVTAGAASEQEMSVSGTLGITFTPEICQNGTFAFVTDTPIVFDDALGYTTGGELTVNGATTITYNSDGSITVTTNGQSETYQSGFDLTQVCPIGAFGAPAAYYVTYSGNGNTGGSVPVDSNEYQEGQTVTVLGNTGSLVNAGYTFVGWNTEADGSGTTYTPGQQFIMGTANVTLYAVWTSNLTYAVTYSGNGNTGGTPPVDPNSYQEGQTVTVLGNTGGLVNTGYSFVGWNTLSGGTGTTYTPGQTFPMPAANVTLYAVWSSSAVLGYAYVANLESGDISQYTIAPAGTLIPMSPPTVAAGPLGSPCPSAITADPSGQYVYATDSCSGIVYQYTIGTGGTLSAMTPSTVTAVSASDAIAVDPSGQYVYVANNGNNSISQYSIGTGGLLSAMTPSTAEAGVQPSAIAADPTAPYVYVANLDGSVWMYGIGAGGVLTLPSVTLPYIAAGAEPDAITADPTGQYVYAANLISDNVSEYTIGTAGILTFLTPSTVGAGAAPAAITAAGQYVYTANEGGTVSQYNIVSGGLLSAMTPSAVPAGTFPDAIAVDPTGQYVYVANEVDGTISQYTIGTGGALTPLSTPVSAGTEPRSITTAGIH